MPHLRLEYTDNISTKIDFRDLFSELHHVLVRYGSIDIDNCKSRAIRLENYFTGDGVKPSVYVHLAVRFFAGRSEKMKATIGEQFRQVLIDKFVSEDKKNNIQVTVEIQEIDKSLYFKYP